MSPSACADRVVVVIPGLGTFTFSDFADPFWLWFALVPVAVVGIYVAMQQRSRERFRRFAGPGAAARLRRPWRRHLPVVAMVMALAALTLALAQPMKTMQVPVNRGVVMLVVDVSESMKAKDVEPTRLEAAERAATTFVDKLSPGINLGLVAFSGNADVVVSPTPRHDATTTALGLLRTGEQTATGVGLFAALSSIHTLDSVLSQLVSTSPPARIVLLSDGKENTPDNLDAPTGAYTAATCGRSAARPGVDHHGRHPDGMGRRRWRPKRRRAGRRRLDAAHRRAVRREGVRRRRCRRAREQLRQRD